jgi:hypothetical protein
MGQAQGASVRPRPHAGRPGAGGQLASQLVPSKPARHVQVWLLTPSAQVPLLLQGLGSQSSMSVCGTGIEARDFEWPNDKSDGGICLGWSYSLSGTWLQIISQHLSNRCLATDAKARTGSTPLALQSVPS